MLEAILKKQRNYLLTQKKFRSYNGIIKNCVDILNTDSILCISGMKYTGSTELANEIVQKTTTQDVCFYFNPHIDSYGTIHNEKDLILLMDYNIRTGNDIKIVILEDCNTIDGIKKFIIDLYKSKNFKIIIVGNNIKVDGVKESQLYPLSFQNIRKNEYIFGGLPHIRAVPDKSYKQVILDSLLSSIIEKEVSVPYNIKNTSNFKKVLSFLASQNQSLSLREVHRLLEEHKIHISLITLIEYINISITTKILYKLELFDFKKNTSIHTSVIYHFTDIGIRSTLSNFDIIHYNNIIGNELLINGYQLYTGKNGTFKFDIYAVKGEKTLGIACSDSDDKIEVRKLARKLSKVPGLQERYVIVQNKEKLAMRKFFENGVQICEVSEFIENL